MGVKVELPWPREQMYASWVEPPEPILAWLEQHVGPQAGDWDSQYFYKSASWQFWFKNAKDAVLFKLTWLGAGS